MAQPENSGLDNNSGAEGVGRRMSHWHLVLLLMLGWVVLNAALDGALGWALRQSRAQFEKNAEINVANLSRMLELNVSTVLSEINLTLLNTLDEMAQHHLALNPGNPAFNHFLTEQAKRIPYVQGLRVIDTSGKVVYAVGNVQNLNVNLSDRDHFQRVRDSLDPGLVITGPIQGRISGKWLLIISRRVSKPDGSFGGEIHASVAVDTFSQIFKSLNLGPHGVVSMWDSTTTLARYPVTVGAKDTIGTKKPSPQLKALLDSGTKEALYHARAPTDNVTKSYSIRKVGDHPLWVIAGLAENDYLAPWWDEVRQVFGIALVFALFTIFLTRVIYRYWQMDRRISNSEDLFSTLALHAPIGIFQTDATGNCTYVNNKWGQLTGQTSQQAAGAGWAAALHQEDRARVLSQWNGALQAKRDFSVEYRFVAPSGEVHWVSCIAAPLKSDLTDAPSYIGCVTDITDRKKMEHALLESEELFRTLCDSAPIGIFRADCEGRITYVNPHCEKISGLSGEQSLGQGWLRAIHPEDREIFGNRWLEAIGAGRSVSQECRVLTPEGETVVILTQATPIMARLENRISYVGIVEDITELRRAMQEMNRTQKLESLGLLAGGIAHDFNNILTAIVGNISLARMQINDPEKVGQRLEDAETASSRARDLTHQLLTFARGGEPVKKVIKVENLLRETASFACHGSAVRCEFELAEELWPVRADEGQLFQVINNIVINACHAMPEGGTVTIGAANDGSRLDGKKSVRIFVRDTGTGISEHHAQKIFDPYFTTKKSGSGLGLATCFSIVKKHDGIISFESGEDRGTLFNDYLPALEQEAPPQPGAEPALVPGCGRVLVMDDEAIVSEIAQAMLEELGYTVECARNGSDAVALYRK